MANGLVRIDIKPQGAEWLATVSSGEVKEAFSAPSEAEVTVVAYRFILDKIVKVPLALSILRHKP